MIDNREYCKQQCLRSVRTQIMNIIVQNKSNNAIGKHDVIFIIEATTKKFKRSFLHASYTPCVPGKALLVL